MKSKTKKAKALRYNQDKLRYDLVPQLAHREYVKVLTAGSVKYSDRNWELGMEWLTTIASLKRHLASFELGEDLDPETGISHMAHVMCNAAFLTEFTFTRPEFDNRVYNQLKEK